MYRRNQLSSATQIYSCQMMPVINFLGSLGRSNDTGISRPSSTESEPPEASSERSRGQDAGNRNAEDLYEQMKPKKYQDLHPGAQRLDRQLFQTLQTIVEGRLLSVISQLTGQYACYTFSIIAMILATPSAKLNNTQAVCHEPHARAAIAWRRQQVITGLH